jgi:hypothetical protein
MPLQSLLPSSARTEERERERERELYWELSITRPEGIGRFEGYRFED